MNLSDPVITTKEGMKVGGSDLLRFQIRFRPRFFLPKKRRSNLWTPVFSNDFAMHDYVSSKSVSHRCALTGGDVAQLVQHRTGTSPTQVRFPGAASRFSPRVNFQCRLSYGVRTPPCAFACIYIFAQVKDPVVHVRVRWIMETLKHPACTVSWVAPLCHSWLSPGKTTRISHGSDLKLD